MVDNFQNDVASQIEWGKRFVERLIDLYRTNCNDYISEDIFWEKYGGDKIIVRQQKCKIIKNDKPFVCIFEEADLANLQHTQSMQLFFNTNFQHFLENAISGDRFFFNK